jgi:3',5'-nucleoside bisphosphate phosphatase
MYDLHTHSLRSDGTTPPAENARLAATAGLRGFALTDHDTCEGWVEARAAADRLGVAFVPGVELSTEQGGWSVHVLGYWVDDADAALAAECARLREERLDRARRILGRLDALGAPVALEAVRRHAGDAPIGRPHIAAALVDAGHVPDFAVAFDRYLADGRPAHVGKRALDPVDGVRLIVAAGGVAVLAHPALTAGDLADPGAADGPLLALVERMVDAGLAGIEADHAGHDPVQRARWRAVARRQGLHVTGSSDFHGRNKDVAIGAGTTPADTVAALAELRGRASAPRGNVIA